ncbi:hypothetical protein A2U01_0007700 [Trifolium medium]|uniref:Uncharacterized protein n=1 Tax=Trifolium medium TaxID=97028 RepID=A0A392MH59_9FABA|nr:hypothetical protein [Trifolium medium]
MVSPSLMVLKHLPIVSFNALPNSPTSGIRVVVRDILLHTELTDLTKLFEALHISVGPLFQQEPNALRFLVEINVASLFFVVMEH